MSAQHTLVIPRTVAPAVLTGRVVEAGKVAAPAQPKPLSFMDAVEWMLWLTIGFFVVGAIVTS